ncbi:MAG TPA: diguanylate cyclase [Bryobacteraceae bacterium]|jgi:diguanylate cyclase (GGDEF)-like protein|nr:diguanylate cyclase [Bryobacteraceae bacterium]
MISLRPYLFGERNKDADSAYRRIIGLFLQGIALHAVEGDKTDYDRFRFDIDNFAKQIGPDTPMSELLVAVGGALRAMEDYNRRTSKVIHRQNSELQKMVSMLTQTVITIGASGESSVTKLQDIEKSIEHARMLEDMQVLKLRLGECLKAVREEALRQKTDGQNTLEILRKELEFSQDRVGSVAAPMELDASTGLPNKKEALKAIQAVVESPQNKFLAIAVVSRVQAVNARFGYAVGDSVLATFAEHFRKNLGAQDQVFRWHGPAVIALLEREERLEKVRDEIRRFAEAKLEKTAEIGNRTVLLPISASWSIFLVAPPMEDLLKKMEAFTAAQVPQ